MTVELLNEKGKARVLSSTERRNAVIEAIDFCDPKLVQIFLGAKYCMLWQYWLIRAIFNYDMLSLSKVANCEFPLAIANEQLKYLDDKASIDETELNAIVAQKKVEYYEKTGEFYNSGRTSEIGNGQTKLEGVSEEESIASQFADSHLRDYTDGNKGCHIQNSIEAAITAQFSEECESMINETAKECEQQIKKASSVNDLKSSLSIKIGKLKSQEELFSAKIDKVNTEIIAKMQDHKFVDKTFVNVKYEKLLDDYFNSATCKGNSNNPLYKYTLSNSRIAEAKKCLKKLSMGYGFGELIDYATQKYKGETDQTKKETYLDIIRVLAINGAHSESLATIFNNSELEKLALQSIFTVAKRVDAVLFDFDTTDMGRFISTIVGEDGNFPDARRQNVRILKESGSSFVTVTLNKLKSIEVKLKERRERGEANHQVGFYNSLYYKLSKLIRKIKDTTLEPQSKDVHEKVYEVLYNALGTIYLAMATSDDRVLIDYVEEVRSQGKKETNRDIADIYSVLYSLLKEYETQKVKDDPASDTSYWQRYWLHFQGISSTFQARNINEDKKMKILRIATYVYKVASDEYDEYNKHRFTTVFSNLSIKFVPSNCLINWLGATHEGIKSSDDVDRKQKDCALAQEVENTQQEAQRAQQEAQGRRKAEQRAKQEAQGRRKAEQRADKFAAILERMGIDPNTALEDTEIIQGASAKIDRG
ncbi:MAG: hypothetical protein QWI36_00305 [Wolbachia endosymbiont of Tyrophagus putrescentiae]|nr:hypothetical protein [Wolbachia endosymbiont of Tyrophagus putrescentiae]